MKKIIGIFTLLSFIGTISIAQAQEKSKYREIRMTKQSQAINVSADQLWKILGPGFEDAGLWSRAVDHSEGKGEAKFEGATCDLRSCDVNAKGFSKVTEKLTHYDDAKQELTYALIEGNPGFVVSAENFWQVVDLGNGKSALKMTVSIDSKKFMGAIMGRAFEKNINQLFEGLFEDLTIYAETGQASEYKQARMAKLAKKG
jgi:hypothetical protein